MQAHREIIAALVAAGMESSDAAALLAQAVMELTAVMPTKGALRTRRWRERKASQTVTVTPGDVSVTNRHKASHVTESDVLPYIDSSYRKESLKKERVSIRKKPSVTSRMTQDWRPDDERWTFAIFDLGSTDQAEFHLRRFINHYLANGKRSADWNAAFYNWVTSPYQQGSKTNGNGQKPRPGSKEETREETVLALRELRAYVESGGGEPHRAADGLLPGFEPFKP